MLLYLLKQSQRLFILLLLCIFLFQNVDGQNSVRQVKNEAFKTGEKLQWRFYYDAWIAGITAGVGVIEVKETSKIFNGREVFHIDAEGKSKGMFNWFYKVHDQFDSYVDKEFMAPHYFVRRTREGDFKQDDEYHFDQRNNKVTCNSGSYSTMPYIQDLISAVYYARTINTDTLKPGDIIPISFFLDDSVYTSSIIFEGKEVVKIKLGKFKCLRFKPGMATGEVFSKQFPMTLWVTDDKNHIPILAQSAIIVGNLKAELKDYEGLTNPFTSCIEKYE